VKEFGEGCGDSMRRVDIVAEFVVSAADILDECSPATYDVR
jgi:hypothetical protein